MGTQSSGESIFVLRDRFGLFPTSSPQETSGVGIPERLALCLDGLAVSCVSNHARANRQSRLMVIGATSSTSATSFSSKPPKNRSSTTCAARGASWFKRSSASFTTNKSSNCCLLDNPRSTPVNVTFTCPPPRLADC